MLKKLTSLFVEVEKAEEKNEKVSDKENKKSVTETETSSAPSVIMPSSTVGSVNSEMAEMLASSIEAANLEGFDYLEFRDSVAKMANIPMAEQQKFQTVFATAQTMGCTKDRLLSAIDHYKSIIDQKRDEFLEHVNSVIESSITTKEKTKANNEQKITEATEKISELTNLITDLQKENLNLTNEINTENLNIQNTKASFEATYGVVAGRLEEDKNKISTYLVENS